MSKLKKFLIALLVIILLLAAFLYWFTRGDTADLALEQVSGTDPVISEPNAESFPTINVAKAVGWPEGETPIAAEGLVVSRFAEGLDHPRTLYTLPNGDVLASLTNRPPSEGPSGIEGIIMGWLFDRAGAGTPSADEIVLLRDGDGDGTAEIRRVIADGFESPSGLAWGDGTLYVAQHDGLFAVPYELGAETLGGEPRKLMDLPAAGGHWMRNIILSEDGTEIFVAVGSDTNIGDKGMEAEEGRAMIWEYDLETGRARQFAAGLRNANGLAFNPWSGELWTTVNERDMLGSDLVPDYLTNVPIGAQYGWPWYYWGDQIDRRVDGPIPQYLGEYVRTPEYALGPHVAALGFVFSEEGNRLGAKFPRGAFIARHGSWNRKPAAGYDVVFVAFDERGNPVGTPQPVLTGFLEDDDTTKGRPTWVTWAQDGALLVSDDTAGIIWRVTDPAGRAAAAQQRISGSSLPPQRELNGDPRSAFARERFNREQAGASGAD